MYHKSKALLQVAGSCVITACLHVQVLALQNEPDIRAFFSSYR